MTESIDSRSEERSAARASRVRILVGFLIILGSVAFLVIRGARDSMVYYISVTELVERDRGAALDGLRVKGNVVPGTIEHEELVLRFEMTDGHTNVPVIYRDIVPDTFGENGEVVVEGAFDSGEFEASFLMAKCPSKYEAEMEEAPEGEAGAKEGETAQAPTTRLVTDS